MDFVNFDENQKIEKKNKNEFFGFPEAFLKGKIDCENFFEIQKNHGWVAYWERPLGRRGFAAPSSLFAAAMLKKKKKKRKKRKKKKKKKEKKKKVKKFEILKLLLESFRTVLKHN